MSRTQGIDRNHGTSSAFQEEEIQVVRMRTIWRICLYINTIDSVIHIKVVHVNRSREGFQSREHVSHGESEQLNLVPVRVEVQLRDIGLHSRR